LCCLPFLPSRFFLFFFHAPAPTDIYALSLHDALPIFLPALDGRDGLVDHQQRLMGLADRQLDADKHSGLKLPAVLQPHQALLVRSEEHTSELQSLTNLVCRLLLAKKKTITINRTPKRR